MCVCVHMYLCIHTLHNKTCSLLSNVQLHLMCVHMLLYSCEYYFTGQVLRLVHPTGQSLVLDFLCYYLIKEKLMVLGV